MLSDYLIFSQNVIIKKKDFEVQPVNQSEFYKNCYERLYTTYEINLRDCCTKLKDLCIVKRTLRILNEIVVLMRGIILRKL